MTTFQKLLNHLRKLFDIPAPSLTIPSTIGNLIATKPMKRVSYIYGGHKGIPLGINFLKTCPRRHPLQQPPTRRQMLLLGNNIRQVLQDGCYMVSRWRWTSDVWHSKIHVPPSKHNRLGFKTKNTAEENLNDKCQFKTNYLYLLVYSYVLVMNILL